MISDVPQLRDPSIDVLTCGPVNVWEVPYAIEYGHVAAVERVSLVLHYQVLPQGERVPEVLALLSWRVPYA